MIWRRSDCSMILKHAQQSTGSPTAAFPKTSYAAQPVAQEPDIKNVTVVCAALRQTGARGPTSTHRMIARLERYLVLTQT